MVDTLTLPWEQLDERSALATKLAADTARAIIEQELCPGTLLTEADLASTHGSSRTPAREAMLQLKRWGLIQLFPKKGAVITAVTTNSRRDLLAVRGMFEIDAIRALHNAPQALENLRVDLEAILSLQRKSLRSNDVLAFASSDYAFHARIIRSGSNSVVTELLDLIGPRLARLTYLAVSAQPDTHEALLAEHEQLMELTRSGATSEFAELARYHIDAGHFASTIVRNP